MELKVFKTKPQGTMTIAEVAQFFGRSTLTSYRYLDAAEVKPMGCLSRGDRGRPTHLFRQSDVEKVGDE